MNILDIPLRSSSNPSLSIKEINALLTELRQYTNSRRVNQSGIGTSLTSKFPDDQYINIKFTAEYPSYSVFTIQPSARAFYPPIANPDSDDVIDPDSVPEEKAQVYVTNGGQPTDNGSVFDCYLIGMTRPHRIRYSGTAPETGDRMQPVAGQSYLIKQSSGIFTAVSEPDLATETVWVVRDPLATAAQESDRLRLVEADDCIQPGQSGTAILLTPIADVWTPTTSIEIYDPLNANMVLPGERVWVKTRLNASDETVGDIVGSHGLHRPARISGSSDLACNGSATATIYQSTDTPCADLVASNCSVTACYKWGDTRKIRNAEDIWIQYTGAQWEIIPVHRPRWAMGVLGEDVCGTSPVSVEQLFYVDGCQAASPTTVSAVNDYTLSGQTGDNALLVQLEDDSWSIVQIQHHVTYIADDIRFNNCGIDVSKYQASTMACTDPTWTQAIQLYSNPVITGFRHESQDASNPDRCWDIAKYKNYCFFEDKSQAAADGEVVFATYYQQFVLRDWDVVGLNIVGSGLNVYVRCYDPPEDIPLHTGVDCSSGSGQ